MRKWIVYALVWTCLLSGLALAENTDQSVVTPVVLETQAGTLCYPRLDNHPDAMIQFNVNQSLLADLDIQKLLDELNGLRGMEKVFHADYKATLKSDILSVVLTHKGEEKARSANQTYATANYDLLTGEPVRLEQLFTDVDAAVLAMETICEDKVTEYVSSYLENGQVTPLPQDAFYLTPDSITFYYPEEQFAYFSGYCGSVSFAFYELKDYLDLSENSVLARLGAEAYWEVQPDSAQQIAKAAEAGKLPGIQPMIGDSLSEWLEQYRLLCDPDFYPGGRLFQVEAGEMRGIWLLTDAMTEAYETNKILGIRADRLNLFGLQVGDANRDEWLSLLGEPANSVYLEESAAMDYLLPPGQSDYYTFGEHQLRLHSNEDGTLVSVWLLD